MSTETMTTDNWALSRELEAEQKTIKAAREARFQAALDGFKKWSYDLAKARADRYSFVGRQADQEVLLQHAIVKSLDQGDDAPTDNRPTLSEALASVKGFLSRTSKTVRNYFDLSYRRITFGQAVEILREHTLVARLGGTTGVVIIGGRGIAKGEDGHDYYEEQFTIYQDGDVWVTATSDREVFSRNLDEAVKATIRLYVRDDVATDEKIIAYASAGTNLEDSGPVPG